MVRGNFSKHVQANNLRVDLFGRYFILDYFMIIRVKYRLIRLHGFLKLIERITV